ncbi:MAG: PAS domain-containing sensor histidine kinase [Promethearchaeota archaeon]|nr:MAG: PAS domain-containing sensor histidine kinase [Candidatus Lokiarchaeota archaeon]
MEDITSEDLFVILNNVRDAILIIVDQKVYWVNQTFQNNFEYAINDIVGKSIDENLLGKNFVTKLDFFEKNSDSVSKTYLHDIVLSGKATGKPAYTAHYQIELKTFLFKGRRAIMASFRRTIPRKQQLIDIEDLLSFDILGIAIMRDGKMLYTNQRYAEMKGYSRDEVLQWEPYEFLKTIHPEDQEFVKKQSIMKERGEPGYIPHYEFRGIRGDNTTVHFEVFSQTITFEDSNANLVILNDITEAKQAESAFRQSEERFKMLVDRMEEGFAIGDENDNFTYVNNRFCEILGYNAGDLIGKNIRDIVHSRYHYILDEQMEMRKRGRSEPYELILAHKSGVDIPTLIGPAGLFDEETSDYIGCFAVFTDITELKNMESEKLRLQHDLLNSQRIESLGILAGGIAHDFNNILTSILGNLSLAKVYLEGDPSSDLKDIVIEAENATVKAKSLTQQLLTFAKGGAPIRKTTSSIGELIKTTTNFVKRGKSCKAKFDIAEKLHAVDIDEAQMSQVINNLVLNAIQAMPNGGTVYIRGENTEISGQLPIPIAPGKYLRIEVQDEGVGIPPENLPKIFDPYFTTKLKENHGEEVSPPRGLGLTTAYSIITNHKGIITVESELGVGSKFIIYLPASNKKADRKPMTKPIIQNGKGRVLLLDDEPPVRKIAKKMLEKLGYDVILAITGDEAIEMYKKSLNGEANFDLLIMDLTIPGGLGGLEAFKEIIKFNPDVKAVVSSGYSNDPVLAHFSDYGFAGVLVKPYTIEGLSKTLASILQQK